MSQHAKMMANLCPHHSNFLSCVSFDNKECLENCIQRCPNILKYRNEWKENVFHMVCISRSTRCLEYLQTLSEHMGVFSKEDMRRYDHRTPLHNACIYKYHDNAITILKEMFDKYIGTCGKIMDINAQDEDGNTPLHYAVERSDEYNISQLLHYGADPFIPNNKGKTAYDMVETKTIKELLDEATVPIKEPCD